MIYVRKSDLIVTIIFLMLVSALVAVWADRRFNVRHCATPLMPRDTDVLVPPTEPYQTKGALTC